MAPNHKRRALCSIRSVLAHRPDIICTLYWGHSGRQRGMAARSAYYREGPGGILRGRTVPSGNSTARVKRKVLFYHSQLQILRGNLPSHGEGALTQPEQTGTDAHP